MVTLQLSECLQHHFGFCRAAQGFSHLGKRGSRGEPGTKKRHDKNTDDSQEDIERACTKRLGKMSAARGGQPEVLSPLRAPHVLAAGGWVVSWPSLSFRMRLQIEDDFFQNFLVIGHGE